MKALKRAMLIALAAMALMMAGAAEAQAATKKPGEVTHLGETKVTSSSISFKFNKAKRAKEYEICVYEAKNLKRVQKKTLENFRTEENEPWVLDPKKATKKLVKKLTTKKTKCTINGLDEGKVYAIKVRAVNGDRRGKWVMQFMKTVLNEKGRENAPWPGCTTAEGKYLKKQYKNWKKYEAKSSYFSFDGIRALDFSVNCVKTEDGYRQTDPNSYRMDDLLRCYRRGYWTDVEAYQIMKNIMDDCGINCRIIRNIQWVLGHDDKYHTEDYGGYLFVDLKNMTTTEIYPDNSVNSSHLWAERYYDLNPSGVMPTE